jgi:hypothetical protein
MRKALMAFGLTLVSAWIVWGGRATASQMCSTPCEGGTLSCTSSSGACTSAPGQVTCCGQTHTCTAYDSWYVCVYQCVHGFPPPGAGRAATPAMTPAVTPLIQGNCIQTCGTAPPLTFSC